MRHMQIYAQIVYTDQYAWLVVLNFVRTDDNSYIWCVEEKKIFIILPLYTGQVEVVNSKYQVLKKPKKGDLVEG